MALAFKNLLKALPPSTAAFDANFAAGVFDPRITFTRATDATYVNSAGNVVTATTDGPRITYDPSSLECLGYLNEPQRSNLLLRSQEFDNGSWTKLAASATAGATTAPDGTATGCLITGDGTSFHHGVRQSQSSLGSGSTTTVFAKAGTCQYLQIFFDVDAAPYANFDIGSGVVGTTGAGTTSAIQALGGGWYRCSATHASAAATNPYIVQSNSASATRNPVFTSALTFYLWGAQLEAASTASSYIPTAGTSATRAADVAYVDVATWLPALSVTNATFYAEFVANGLEPTNFERILSPDSIKTFLSVENSTTIGAYDGGVTATASGAAVVGGSRKAAASLGAALRTVAYGGTTGTHATNFYDAPTRLYIGSNQGSGNFFSGTIKTARTYYGAQSAAQIAALTT